MLGFLGLGFFVGMAHAVEADHVAAVGAMAMTRNSSSKRGLALRGAAWGLGHTITLFAICSAVILFGLTLTERTSAALEFGVGVMLVVLGLDVLRRLRAKQVHFHAHDHGSGPHIHAHSHAGDEAAHKASTHEHTHPARWPVKALLVGLVHGAAGSAGLLALAVAATQEPLAAVGYVALFGIGSILGMGALSFVAAFPLGAAERNAKWLHRGLTVTAGAVAVFIGAEVMLETGPLAWGLG